ncbi:MAG: hypothetical protein FJ315_07010, partial [SAR202 cluster bacterium]|nr:hypothetical protein [SAR202 cluster bacterium]
MSPGRPTSKPWTAVAAVALFAVLLAAACEDDPQAGGQSPAQKRVLAPIERVTIRSVGTPLSYVATIVSGLPTGCARFDGFVIARSGEAINISVSNRMPADETVACAMVYGTRETSVPLGGDFVAGRTYTVVVNDTHRTTFTAQLIPQIGEPTAALLGVPFQIGLGQAALINAEALEVRFAEVLEDSRGPLDVTCVQAGRVRALFLVSQAGAVLGTLELGLGPGQGEPAAGNAGRYTLSLIALDPHRRAANGSNRTPYMATLSVSRAHVQALRGGMLATFTV